MVEKTKVYLRIKVDDQDAYLKAFENDTKTKESDPDYSGIGVKVWLNDAKPRQEVEESRPEVEVVKPSIAARRF